MIYDYQVLSCCILIQQLNSGEKWKKNQFAILQPHFSIHCLLLNGQINFDCHFRNVPNNWSGWMTFPTRYDMAGLAMKIFLMFCTGNPIWQPGYAILILPKSGRFTNQKCLIWWPVSWPLCWISSRYWRYNMTAEVALWRRPLKT